MRNLFFNIPLDIVEKNEAVKTCQKALQGDKCCLVFFINAHCFNIAQKSPNYMQAIQGADFIYNDGIGMKLGSFFTPVKFKSNLNGTDLIPVVINEAVKLNKKIFLVGGKPGVASAAKLKLEEKHPKIQIVGTHHGYFSPTDLNIIHEINKSKADLVIAGMGVPIQELWLHSVKNEFSSAKLCIAGGAIIDFISGNIIRAPQWVRIINFEWMYRLLIEPRRMWRRYLVGNFRFFFHVISLYLKSRQYKSIHFDYSKIKP